MKIDATPNHSSEKKTDAISCEGPRRRGGGPDVVEGTFQKKGEEKLFFGKVGSVVSKEGKGPLYCLPLNERGAPWHSLSLAQAEEKERNFSVTSGNESGEEGANERQIGPLKKKKGRHQNRLRGTRMIWVAIKGRKEKRS